MIVKYLMFYFSVSVYKIMKRKRKTFNLSQVHIYIIAKFLLVEIT